MSNAPDEERTPGPSGQPPADEPLRGSDEVARALGLYLEIVDSCAPGLVEGLYVVGSFALGDWRSGRSDVDIVAITAEPATDEDFGGLRTAHALLAEQQPWPSIDGPYVAWGDLITPPTTGLHRPWTLNGELRHDGDCFEINPVTWYTLATYGVTVRGQTVDRLGIYVDLDSRIRFVTDNLQTYWRSVSEQLADTYRDGTAAPSAEGLEWAALGALRLHCTAFTGDVISKGAAAGYGRAVLPPELVPVVDLALEIRGGGPIEPQPADMVAAARVIEWCVAEVDAALAP